MGINLVFSNIINNNKIKENVGMQHVVKLKNGGAILLNDSHVVPYNPYLLLKFGCHINIEYVFGQKACKYIFKYLLKGFTFCKFILFKN